MVNPRHTAGERRRRRSYANKKQKPKQDTTTVFLHCPPKWMSVGAGQEPVAKQILRRKWGWIGHTLRKPASSTTRQALTWNPQGKRKRGQPRNSWRWDTEAEPKQQGTNWSVMARAAQNRVQWRGVVDGLCMGGSEKFWFYWKTKKYRAGVH